VVGRAVGHDERRGIVEGEALRQGITPAAATQAWVPKPPLEPMAATGSPTLRW
jgi:hypothetical protein